MATGRWRIIAVLPLVCLPIMGAASKCDSTPGGKSGGPAVANSDDGTHNVSSFGKFAYGNVVGPGYADFPQCRWRLEVRADGSSTWYVLTRGSSTKYVRLPRKGAYAGARVISKGCGPWKVKVKAS